MKKITLLFAMLAFSFGFAQNGGDTCGTAVVVPAAGMAYTATTITLASEGGEQGTTQPRSSAWFSYTPAAAGTIDVSSCLGGADTRVYIGTGTCGALTTVVSADDDCAFAPDGTGSAFAAEIAGFNVTAGTTYLIEWDDRWGDGVTAVTFDWSLTYTAPPACSDPIGISASATSGTTADLSWGAAAAGETGGYEYIVVAAGGDPDVGPAVSTGTSATGVTTATATGLTEASLYDAYARTVCAGPSTSGWTGPAPFATPCSTPIVAPYLQDFEAFTLGNLAAEACWLDGSAAAPTYFVNTGATGSGSTGPSGGAGGSAQYVFVETSSPSSGGDMATLVAPIIDLSALTTPTATFDVHAYGADIGTMDFIVNGTVVWSQTGQVQTAEADAYSNIVVDLSAYAGLSIVSSFKYTAGASFAGDIALDNVFFGEPPTCISPTATTAVVEDCAASQFSVDVDVTSLGDAATVTISNDAGVAATTGVAAPGIVNVGPFTAGAFVTITVEHDGDATCNATLAPVADACPPPPPACGGNYYDSGGIAGNYGVSESTTVTISPDVAGDGVIVNFTAFSVENNGDTACWDNLTIHNGPDATFPTIDPAGGGTEWCYDRFAGSEGGPGDLQGMTISATDASGALTFVFTSDTSVTRAGWEATVSCAALSTPETNFEGFKYFPNPVSGALSLRSQNNIENVAIYNMLGQEVVRTAPNALASEVDMTNLNTGAYFVKVTINGATETVRIIKQ